jgi:hypothetical protein
MAFPIPVEVEAVSREFRTCEFSTLAADSTPITSPSGRAPLQRRGLARPRIDWAQLKALQARARQSSTPPPE